MGQIVGLNAKCKRANLNALGSVPTPANGEIILVSSDNSMTSDGQGNFDCYIVGDGEKAATALPLHYLADEEPVAGSTQGIMSAWAHKFVKPITDEMVEVSQTTEDVTQVYDDRITEAYIASNGRIYGASSGSTFVVNLKQFAVDTILSYSITGGSIGIVLSETKPAKNATYTVVATSGSGQVTVPAGYWLGWGRNEPAGAALTQQVETIVVKMPLFPSDVEDEVTEDSNEPVTSAAIYSAIQAGKGQKTEYADIVPDGSLVDYYIASSNSKVYSGNNHTINYKYLTEDTTIRYNVGESTESVAYHSSIPSANTQVTLVATSGNSGEAVIPAGNYLLWVVYREQISCFVGEKTEVPLQYISADTLVEAENIKQRKDTRSAIIVDGSMPLGWYKNSCKDIFDVTAATADTISVSSADAASFDSTEGLVAVKHGNGNYTCHLFTISGNVLTILRKKGYDDDVSLADVVKCQGVYDTNNSGMGQHLSAFGYLAYANYIAQAIHARCSIKQDNLVYGLHFTEQGVNSSAPYYKSGLLYDTDMNVIAVPRYHQAKFTGTLASGISAHAGVLQNNQYDKIRACALKYFAFVQNTQGTWVEFDLPSDGHLGNGYVEITGGCYIDEARTGHIRVDVLTDGVSVYNTMLANSNEGKIVCDNLDLQKHISVRFTLTDAAITVMYLTDVRLYQAAEGKTAVPTIKTTDKIAIIGDSWTQFPPASGVVESDNTYNTIDTLANGQQAKGYCYLPKELSRLLGVEIDNYGKSDMTASYGIEQMADIIKSGKPYDYIILEYYINDRTASTDANIWLSKMAQLVAMCKSINAKPIILGPTSTNSINQSVGLIAWWHQLIKGLNL